MFQHFPNVGSKPASAPSIWDNTIGKSTASILSFRHQDGVQTLVCTIVFPTGRHQGCMSLRVGVDQ
jgi:hypothetical protein